MKKYIITRSGRTAEVLAKNPEDAARKFARTENGRKSTALRVTGSKCYSGYFRIYVSCGCGLNAVGDPFHVF